MSNSLRPHGCSLPGFSIHGILQERILEWVAIPFSGGSSWSRDGTWVSYTAGRFFTSEPQGTPSVILFNLKKERHCNSDEPWRYYARWNNLVTKDTVWFHLHKVSRVVRFLETENKSGCQWLGGGGNAKLFHEYIISVLQKILETDCVCVLVPQSCPTLCDPMDCSLPGSSVHGILQARILE